MTRSPSTARRGLPAVLAALLLATAALVPASPASAHDELVSTDPVADSVVEALPPQITLTYSAELLGDAGTTEVVVTDAAGTALTAGEPVVAGTTVTQSLAADGGGVVTVLWRVVSSDGHPISGEFSFTAPAASTPAPSETTASPTPEPMMSTMATPTASESSTPAPDSEETAASPAPWIVGGIILLALIAALVYLLVARARRTRNGGGTSARD